jgi:catechol 2,3-dioxygenase-like lactoylglutathione lyase family enzyme
MIANPLRRACGAAVLITALLSQGLQAQGGGALQSDLPILGIAGITFRVSDLDKARRYYDGVLGFAEAFTLKDTGGRVSSVFFKVNDDQYVDVVPGLAPGGLNRQVRVIIQSSDLNRLHGIYASRGLSPTPITKGPDGNPVFRIIGPDNATLDFVQYVAGSQQTLARGKFLDPRRLSTHLWHVGLYTKDRASVAPFYQDKLGFTGGRDLPGGRGEYIETPSSDRNLETKFPPLDPNNAATRAQYEREVMGAVQHFAIEVTDMRKARDLAQERGGLTDLQVRAHVGNNRHWLMHLFDQDGSRTEVMETAVQDSIPPMTVMAPGRAVAPPILPRTPGEIPWPSAAPSAPPPAGPAPDAQAPAAAPPASANQQAGRGGGGGGRYVDAAPIDFSDHGGWQSLFDGTSLEGWDGPTDLWHVENGAMVVRSKADPPTGSTYILWTGGEPKDFELKFELKLEGAGANSGVQFRATKLGEVAGNPKSKWETLGYQADVDNGNSNTGALIECCAGPRRGTPPRPDRAFRGQVVRTAIAEGQKPTTLATIGDPDALKAHWKVGEWNQMHLVARGRTMLYFINGQLMSVLIDDHPTRFVDHGVIALQLEGRGDNTASYRNIWLKHLP